MGNRLVSQASHMQQPVRFEVGNHERRVSNFIGPSGQSRRSSTWRCRRVKNAAEFPQLRNRTQPQTFPSSLQAVRPPPACSAGGGMIEGTRPVRRQTQRSHSPLLSAKGRRAKSRPTPSLYLTPVYYSRGTRGGLVSETAAREYVHHHDQHLAAELFRGE